MAKKGVGKIRQLEEVGNLDGVQFNTIEVQRRRFRNGSILKGIDDARLPADPGSVSIIVSSDNLVRTGFSRGIRARSYPDNLWANEQLPFDEKITTSVYLRSSGLKTALTC